MLKVLFIDDDKNLHQTLNLILPTDFELYSAYTAQEGFSILKELKPQVILLDIELPDLNGFEVLKKIMEDPFSPPVIMLSATADIPYVVKAVQMGASDYLAKPFEIEALTGTLRQVVFNKQRSRLNSLKNSSEILSLIIGETEEIQKVKDFIIKFAPHEASVLISGPSGTGKELVATAIHKLSNRANGPFWPINCAALPLSLIESELFGSEKGAYTDARTRAGCFELANGGTIFLDEIGELPLEAQAKLLRVLEEKQIIRLGSSEPLKIDVRVITATNRNLKDLVCQNKFREDLYYRLSVLPINLPSLAQRQEDIILLALYFLTQNKKIKFRLTESARQKLLSHSWPGNVRELRNVIERAMVFANNNQIQAKDIVF